MHPSQSLKYSSEQAIAALKQGMANTKRKDNVPAMTQTLRAIALAGDDANTRAAALAHLGYIACYLRGDVIFGKKKLQLFPRPFSVLNIPCFFNTHRLFRSVFA